MKETYTNHFISDHPSKKDHHRDIHIECIKEKMDHIEEVHFALILPMYRWNLYFASTFAIDPNRYSINRFHGVILDDNATM